MVVEYPDGNVCQEMEIKDEHPDRKSGQAVLTRGHAHTLRIDGSSWSVGSVSDIFPAKDMSFAFVLRELHLTFDLCHASEQGDTERRLSCHRTLMTGPRPSVNDSDTQRLWHQELRRSVLVGGE